jgi:hypothetical protein
LKKAIPKLWKETLITQDSIKTQVIPKQYAKIAKTQIQNLQIKKKFLSTVLGLLFSKYSVQISSFVCFLIIPTLPEGGGGILFYLCPSFRPSKIFLVAFFSATIDGRNLIFGHKLHIGTPYREKRFLTEYFEKSNPKTVERNSDNTRFNKNSSNSKTVC